MHVAGGRSRQGPSIWAVEVVGGWRKAGARRMGAGVVTRRGSDSHWVWRPQGWDQPQGPVVSICEQSRKKLTQGRCQSYAQVASTPSPGLLNLE